MAAASNLLSYHECQSYSTDKGRFETE